MKADCKKHGTCFMRINVWLLLAGICAVSGCVGIDSVRVAPGQAIRLTVPEARLRLTEAIQLGSEQPRSLNQMIKVAGMLDPVARCLTNDYDAQWQAAQAQAFVAEYSTNNIDRVNAAKLGITLARHGQELLPNRVECHYWYAINVGLLADADRSYGLKAVGEMETALKQVNQIDERYDNGGGGRILGILQLRTPAPPISIGSPRKALRALQHATDLFPDYPENWLYLAEALRDNGQPEKAREMLEKVINAPPWPDRQFESAGWKAAALKLRQTLADK